MAATPSDDIVPRLLTIVVCSSPVPSNPQTHTLRAVFRSLRLVSGLPKCPKIVQLDGPQKALPPERITAYAEFTRRVRALSADDADFAHSRVYASTKFLFAAHNLAAAVAHVNTSFLLSLQHDYELARPFDAPNLLRTMVAVPVVRHVRLNMRPNAPARGFDGVVANATDLRGLLVPLTRTCGWSDAPHVASTRYYREFVMPKNAGDHFGGARKFMEESVHYPMQRNGMPGGCWETRKRYAAGEREAIPWPRDFDAYGTYLYGVCSPSDGKYTQHRSLRGSAPQWGLDHKPLKRGWAPSKEDTAAAWAHAVRRGKGEGRGGRGSGRGGGRGGGRCARRVGGAIKGSDALRELRQRLEGGGRERRAGERVDHAEFPEEVLDEFALEDVAVDGAHWVAHQAAARRAAELVGRRLRRRGRRGLRHRRQGRRRRRGRCCRRRCGGVGALVRRGRGRHAWRRAGCRRRRC